MSKKSELGEKLLYGVRLAIDRLIAEKAKNDEDMIVSENGKIVRIPAKQILKEKEEKRIRAGND